MLTTACGGTRTVQPKCVVPMTLGERSLNSMTRSHLSRVSGNHEPVCDVCPNRSVRPKAGVMDYNYPHGMRCTEEQESKFGGKAKEDREWPR